MNRGCPVESEGMTSKPEGVVTPGSAWGQPVYCPGGVRQKSGVNWIQALMRNVGTCRLDVKGEFQVEDP